MQAPENAEGGAEGDYGDNVVAGVLAYLTFISGSACVGAEGAYGREHLQGLGALEDPAPGGDASAAAGVTEPEPLELHLKVPYSYAVDAENVCMYLGPVVRSLPEGVYCEIAPHGKDLHILLTSEDSHLLEIAISTLLNQLSAVIPVFEDFQT